MSTKLDPEPLYPRHSTTPGSDLHVPEIQVTRLVDDPHLPANVHHQYRLQCVGRLFFRTARFPPGRWQCISCGALRDLK